MGTRDPNRARRPRRRERAPGRLRWGGGGIPCRRKNRGALGGRVHGDQPRRHGQRSGSGARCRRATLPAHIVSRRRRSHHPRPPDRRRAASCADHALRSLEARGGSPRAGHADGVDDRAAAGGVWGMGPRHAHRFPARSARRRSGLWGWIAGTLGYSCRGSRAGVNCRRGHEGDGGARLLRDTSGGDHESRFRTPGRSGGGDQPFYHSDAPGRRARRALDGRHPCASGRPRHFAVGRQGQRIPGPGLDLPERCPDARHRLARRDRARNRAAACRELVSGGGMAVNGGGRGWKWSGTDGLWRGYTAIDLATGAYIAVATGAVLFAFRGDGIRGWPWVLTAHALILSLVLLAPRARKVGPIGRFLGDWYPMLLLPALYGEIGILTLSAGFQNDLLIQRLETWVFGSQISYRWIRESPNVVFSWVVHACYLAYYPILYAAPFALWMVGRRDASRHTIFAVMATFYLCYVVFLFFPVAGPRYAFDGAHNLATEVGPARFAAWLLDRGDSWGAAFPSSHVAASVVATGMALRYWRALGLLLLPFTAGLILAVVYGQFHYAVDALAGLMVAAVMLGIMQTAEAAEPQRLTVGDYGVEPWS